MTLARTEPSEMAGVATGSAGYVVDIREDYGWRRFDHGAVRVWLKGRIEGVDIAQLAARLGGITASPDLLADYLRSLSGHFAIVAAGEGWAFAAADRVRSIPVAAVRADGVWRIDDQPERLRRRAGLGHDDIDPDAALSVGMAGYAIEDAALYRGIRIAGPGELFFCAGGDLTVRQYHAYRPWLVREASSASLEAELMDVTLDVISRMLASLDGRMLVIPLSAGRDSRLIASAVKHLGYRNVRCFTYGRAGNFEAGASRAIAERLGYPWTFVPATIGKQRRFFESDEYARYCDFADSGCSLPFVQDMAPLMELKRTGYVPDDAVLSNGNTGDFISGNHIPAALKRPLFDADDETRWGVIIDALLTKHFSLWRSLVTPDNRARIASLLRQSLARERVELGASDTDHGIYEYVEFRNRQCRYVITGQRIYEFLGHEWRLPLWDDAYLAFWEKVPLADKFEQALYTRMLTNANWGGVWQDVPVNRKTVRPLPLVPLRYAAKALHIPLGRERWHRFERRYFQYWMDTTCTAACVPYGRARRDTRGARHHISWLAELYLARHGVALDDLAARA